MFAATIRLGLCTILILGLAGGLSSAREPATVTQAAEAINLETFPLLRGGVAKAPRRLAVLVYAARSNARAAFDFQKKTLEERGWKELPGGYVSDQSCSGAFGKAGFTVSVMTSPGFGPPAAGLVDVRLTNHGNVELSKLPVPREWQPLYSLPTVIAYVSLKPVKEASAAISHLLTADGWDPYGHAGDSWHFKKNAVKLSAWASVAPAQGGKTVVQLSTELMSVDLPAPPFLLDALYADVTKTLSLEVAMPSATLAAFYKEALARAGWRPTSEKLVKVGFEELMIFRNDAKDIATLKVHPLEGKLRATLQQQSAAEFATATQMAEAEDSTRKSELARYGMNAGLPSANDRATVAMTLPTGATELKRKKNRIEFKLAAGSARVAVETIRAELLSNGWKGNEMPLDPTAGSVVVVKKPGKIVAIAYVDAGLKYAIITISATGAEFEEPKAK